MKLHIRKIDFDSNEVTFQINTDDGRHSVGPASVKFVDNATISEIRVAARVAARALGVTERARLTQAVSDLASIETDPLN